MLADHLLAAFLLFNLKSVLTNGRFFSTRKGFSVLIGDRTTAFSFGCLEETVFYFVFSLRLSLRLDLEQGFFLVEKGSHLGHARSPRMPARPNGM